MRQLKLTEKEVFEGMRNSLEAHSAAETGLAQAIAFQLAKSQTTLLPPGDARNFFDEFVKITTGLAE